MAKDPAFLFYSADFMTGTQFFTMEQRGKYISLLCAQHQTGHLSEEDMLFICGSYDQKVFKKFIKDDDGLFFNEVLEGHIEKRKVYAESRRNNRLKGITAAKKSDQKADNKKFKSKKDMSDISSSYVEHMEDVNVNVNKEENKKEKERKVAEKLKNEEEIFSAEVMQFDGQYPEQMLKSFLNYWCERNKTKTAMLWQTKTTFEISRRLVTWSSNNNKGFEKTGNTNKTQNQPVSKVDLAEQRNNDILNNYE